MKTNKLKNSEKFNISEGNVKEDNIFPNDNVKKSHNVANNIAQRNSQDEELMKKIFPHKEIIEGESVLVFPYIEEASPLKDVPQEVVSNMEKTIDHIVDVNKKVSLTELWKKGKLEEYKKYYCKTKWFEDIFQTRCYNKDTEDEWWVLKNEKYNYNNIYHTKDIEVLAPVPSYEEWQQMKAFCEEFNALNVAEENRKLKQLLKECREYVVNTPVYPQGDDNKQAEIHRLVDKIKEALK